MPDIECPIFADHLWKAGRMTRNDAYAWLANALGMTTQAHIGEMDVDQCRRVVEVCQDDLPF